jgi:hypothetical protein
MGGSGDVLDAEKLGKSGRVRLVRVTDFAARPSAVLLVFGSKGMPSILVDWRGHDEARPALLPFDLDGSAFPDVPLADVERVVERMVTRGARRLLATWTDAPGLEIDGALGELVVTWGDGGPTARDLAALRSLHPPFADMSIADLRSRVSAASTFAFPVTAGFAVDARRLQERACQLGLVAVYRDVPYNPSWPPLPR